MPSVPFRRSLLLGGLLFFLYLLYSAHGIPAGDSGDMVTAAYLGGVPHPPGYPLYTFLGWLLTKIPVSTVAFRIGLLSALPHAATVAAVYVFVYFLTKHALSALFAALVLAGNYLFFLYSVTPEVFALFDLFSILLFLFLFVWTKIGNVSVLYFTSFLFGLSLTHHHIILFFIPAVVFLIASKKQMLERNIRSVTKRRFTMTAILSFVLGILPYLYVPIAARGKTIINWNRAVDIPSFIRLVTRADYGTFQSGSTYAQFLNERLLQITSWSRFVLLDLTLVGCVLALLGGYWLWTRSRILFVTIALALAFVGPIFFFYASFPLVNQFMIGTFERFLLPSYTLLAVLIGLGFDQSRLFVRHISKRYAKRLSSILVGGVSTLLFLLPILTLMITLSRFKGWANDRTAENLGRDVLASAPDHAILLLTRDTTLFTAQYVRYVLGVRSDTVVLQANSLGTPDYRRVVADVFPYVILPESEGRQFFIDFVKNNTERSPILTNTAMLPLPDGWVSVPAGLLSLLTPADDSPAVSDLQRENDLLWAKYQDPTAGILTRHNHLMLSDVRDVYASARMRYGTVLLRAGELAAARDEFREAIRLGGDIQLEDAYTSLGLSELWLSECDAAISAFQKAREAAKIPNKEIIFYEAVTLRDCVGDEDRASVLFDEYERIREREQIPLESL